MAAYKILFAPKILAILVLIAIQSVFALKSVAVLELLANASVQGDINAEELRYLTDELRRQADMALPRGGYAVLHENHVKLGVEYVSKGKIGKFGKKFTISVMLYKIGDGKPISSIISESDSLEGLLEIIRKEAKPMFQGILGPKPEPPAAAK